MRMCMVFAQPADSACAAGPRCRWYHECQPGVGCFVYPGHLQGWGFGRNATVVATAFTLGPTIASGIRAIELWSWLFAINIPFGVVAILICLKTLPRIPRATHGFDFSGAMMAACCLGLFILGIGSVAHY
jgi:MFS transporter, DHA2 family, multidrug resistance protein